MTRSVWGETALAVWIREQMDAKGWQAKERLIEALVTEGAGLKAAQRQVNRWTTGKTATLEETSADRLEAIFGSPPPRAALGSPLVEARAERRLAAVEAAVDRIERHLFGEDVAPT